MANDKKEAPAVQPEVKSPMGVPQAPVRMSISQNLLQGALDVLSKQPFNQVADILLAIQQDARPIK